MPKHNAHDHDDHNQMTEEQQFEQARNLMVGYRATDVNPQDVAAILCFALAMSIKASGNKDMSEAAVLGSTMAMVGCCLDMVGVEKTRRAA